QCQITPHCPGGASSRDLIGRCKCSFWFAVAHDILGVFIMMVGVFGGLVIHDLFIYAGAIIIFLSLIWWVFWYSGNIDVPTEELEDDVGLIKPKNRKLSQVVRQMSSRVSNRIRNSFRKNGMPRIEENTKPSNAVNLNFISLSCNSVYCN
uniref:Si:dkey-16i5.8 n=1 Tax=Echeneis naucrates TaxID=173247 RepID=A0A665TX71_ECHNA